MKEQLMGISHHRIFTGVVLKENLPVPCTNSTMLSQVKFLVGGPYTYSAVPEGAMRHLESIWTQNFDTAFAGFRDSAFVR